MGDPRGTQGDEPCRSISFYLLPVLHTNVKMCQDMCNLLTHPTIHATMATFALASMLALLPRTQPLPSVRVLASMGTRSSTSSASVLCTEVVGVPRHRLARTNIGICRTKGQRAVG